MTALSGMTTVILPDELWQSIYQQFLDPSDLVSMKMVSKSFPKPPVVFLAAIVEVSSNIPCILTSVHKSLYSIYTDFIISTFVADIEAYYRNTHQAFAYRYWFDNNCRLKKQHYNTKDLLEVINSETPLRYYFTVSPQILR